MPLASFVWQKVHSLRHPLAISTILTAELSRILGRFTLSIPVSSRNTCLVPDMVEAATFAILSIAAGPTRLADGLSASTLALSALGRHPATIRGLPDSARDFILLTILCSDASLTEQVTIIESEPSS